MPGAGSGRATAARHASTPSSSVARVESLADLMILARLAAARAVRPAARYRDPLEHLAWVDGGAAFEEAGVRGFLDGVPIERGVAGAARVRSLLALLDGVTPPDLGLQYMRLRARRLRRGRGEYFTPGWLVDLVLDRAGFHGRGAERLLDPMCGAGAFLVAAVRRLRGRSPGLPAAEVVRLVQGIDVDPAAVLLARAAYLIELARGGLEGPVTVPVSLEDAIEGEGARRDFQVVAGNPPWIGWEALSKGARRRTRALWERHGLFAERGGKGSMGAILGKGKKDLAMLATCQAADRFLRDGGRLSFVITRSVFQSEGAGSGFRRFVLGDGTPLRVVSVDDFGRRRVFPGAASRAAVLTLEKGAPTVYPVRCFLHERPGGPPGRAWAEPVDPADPTSPWLTGSRAAIRSARPRLGASAYRARAGAYSGGANGVYWLERLARGTGGLWRVRNLPEAGRREVAGVTVRLEAALLYPLLRARDVGPLRAAAPTAWVLLPQDTRRRRGLDETLMAARYPRALAYLRRFREDLAGRRDRGSRSLIEAGAAFYSVFSVGPETLSAWKVVWARIASRVAAAPVGPFEGRPVVPQETCTFVACGSREEACFLAGVLSSSLFDGLAGSFSQRGGKGFGAPHLLERIAVPRFDPDRPSHATLADLVAHEGPELEPARLDAAVEEAWGR